MDEPEQLIVGEIAFLPTGHCGQHGNVPGRVPAGSGYWSGDPAQDLCSYCWAVARDDPHRAPSPDEEILLARHGIERGGSPCFVEAGDDPGATIARLAELVEAGELPRIALAQGPHLGDWLESGGVLPDGAIVRRDGVSMQFGTMPLRLLELQLRGELHGPPIDPDLLVRLEEAKDEHGVVRDADLADEYHRALIEQAEAARIMRGDPEPVIEDGRVFPSTAEDEPPLG
jgi:hypothetical protein